MDESLIMEVWDIFREYIPDKNKETAANQYVDFLVGKDVDGAALEGLLGYDAHLDEAIRYVLDADGLSDEDDFDSDFEDEY